MGDGGVACVPSQHIVERFSICGGSSNGNSANNNGGNNKLSSSTKRVTKVKTMKKIKKVKVKKGELRLKSSVNSGKVVLASNNISNSDINNNTNAVNDSNKDEVEEGELGTLPIENGEFVLEKPAENHEVKSETEKGEAAVDKWKKSGQVEKKELPSGRWQKTEENTAGSWRPSSKDELEKGEFVPDRWRKSELAPKDDFSYSRGRRYDSAKEKIWKGERDWTTPPPPSFSGKYFSEKELSRSGNQLVKRAPRHEAGILGRAPKISSKIVDEDGYDISNGKNYAREYSSGNRFKRQGADGDHSERKHYRGEPDDFTSSKSRKLSENGTRSLYPLEQHSLRSAERYRNASSSSRDRYSSRHYESSRVAYDKYNSSPYRSERSPRDRTRHDHRERSPGHLDRSPHDHSRSPYDRNRHYDRSKSPYDKSYPVDSSKSPFDRSRHSDYRKRSPTHSEWSPRDQTRYSYQRGRSPNFLERTPDHGRHRESDRKSGGSQKKQNNGSRGAEEKSNQKEAAEERPNLKEPNGRELLASVKDSEAGIISKNGLPHINKEEPAAQLPDVNADEVIQENGAAEEHVSMEEDMDICNTPPHDPLVGVTVTGKWVYLDYLGEEQGPSRLCDLKKLMEEGFLVSDHLVKHLDSDRWVTVEKAVSPLVTPNFTSVVSDAAAELVSPPEAPGNLLVDNDDLVVDSSCQVAQGIPLPFDLSSHQKDFLAATEHAEDLRIDERVDAVLDGVTVVPGKEVEIVGEVLHMMSEDDDWERWRKIEGFTWHQVDLGENDQQSGEMATICESALREDLELRPSVLSPLEKDSACAYEDVESFSGQWPCKGGDWKRIDETAHDRTLRKKLVLNDGYPLCQMPKSGFGDPRWHRKDELYAPSQSRRLDLPPWAFTPPEDGNDNSGANRLGQNKPGVARGTRGMMLPVVRINACVVKDHDSFASDARMKARGKDKYSSKSSRNYSMTNETRRPSSEGLSRPKSMHEKDSPGSWKSNKSFSVPKDHVCTADELQLNLGEWYYIDGAGHERGPLSFLELQVLVDRGVIQEYSSVFRKMDKVWVPVTSAAETSWPTKSFELTAGKWNSIANSGGNKETSSMFHTLHPQFIGYTRAKLHELVMKSYKSREFAAAINEVLDPWINARLPKKETEKHIYNTFFQKPDQLRTGKRQHMDGSEDECEMEDVPLQDELSFDDVCNTATFGEESSDSEVGAGPWVQLEGRVLARVFHFLRADMKSLVNVAMTCKIWRSVLNCYKKASRQIDLSSIPQCNDAMLQNIMKDYDKANVCALVLRGCTGISSRTVEEVLQAFSSLSSVDIRGCSQLEDLALSFPNINWIQSRATHSKTRSIMQVTDKSSLASKMLPGLDIHTDDSSGLRHYLESSDRRDSASRLFRQSLYKRSKLYDARKSSSILSRDAHLRRLAMRNGYKRMERLIALSLKDIMKENTFDLFVPKVAEIENKMRSGYYAGRGLSCVKEDIRRMCREAIKSKNQGDARNINRIITLFIRLATSLDGGSESSLERDVKSRKDDSPPGFASTSAKHRRKVTEKKYSNRSNGSALVNGISEYVDYASDREIKRRLSRLNKKSMDSESETSDDLDRSSDATDSESTASDTESDPDLKSETGARESRKDTYFPPDDGLDSLVDEREWGARMTKASLVPPVTRKYEVIDQYVIVADEEEVKRKMHVSLPEDYAEKLNAQRNGTEESDMEIPEVKEYKPRKQLGDEVIEQEVYGIDPYTHNLLLDSMPEEPEWSLLDKHVFIEDVLLRTLNKQARKFTGSGNTPMMYPLKPAFEEILDTAEEDEDWKTVKLCEYILKAIDSRPDDKYVAYRKGLGVVCNKEGGFGEDDFVVEFLGEVYPAWKWFEKQDGIRSLQKDSNDPAPEFYNIHLERPKGDADGYDLVVVDAMHKANYASRICHSCRPNCEAKVTAVDGQYQIGIYTVRPIQYGEEITFDYNSVTESKEEYEASVCLCGSQVCRGSYLNLTGEGAYQKVLKEYHGILNRHQLMLEACELNSVSEEDYIALGEAGLGSCLLDGLPDWLIAYSARLVRFINFERTKLPKEILKHNLEEKKKYFAEISLDFEKSDAEVQAEGVYNQRLQNLALTLDKVRYVMRRVFGDPKSAPPPLRRLTPSEVVSYIWTGEDSLVEGLLQCIAPHVEDGALSELRANILRHDPSSSDDIGLGLRKSLLWLRDEIRNITCSYKCRNDAAADLIHIYAHTKCFIRIQEYETVTSPPVYISPLDLCPKLADRLGSQEHEFCKTYGENYCLGQLMYWHNQANAEPDASLARASRGCLSLPEIGSFYAKAQKPSRQRVYGPRTVKFMLSRMEKQPQRPWPKDKIWSFTSNPKVFGTPMLDAVLNKASLDKEMVHWLKHRPPIFQAIWDR
ncbi:OLC1v1025081C1 [Oldenlandia corymbosa var. corymbosa]|uniref:OLC1v1025081C1 n=1 Tax=Oldenlandia corymbosa var. corymbosa TaxID=529605 RepID=A0AAV1C616_OLDCO|nr:OLC1v1025081C1 [Oldenlandia corymbosa var. corymbosa]